MSEVKKRVYFVDGFSPRKDLVGIVSYLYELSSKDVEFSRFYSVSNNDWEQPKQSNWKQTEYEHDIVSVTYTNDPAWWLLGKRGKVFRFSLVE